MTANSLRLVFAGTPDFAALHLAALLDSPHEIVSVYTQPDRPAGRGKKLQASPVKQLALQNKLPVHQPTSLRDAEAQAGLAALQPDVLVVVAYGLILPQEVLDIPHLACLNVHASLLPRWRGAAPIQRAIEAGDRETGTTIMKMEAGLDTGPMLATARCDITAETTAASLHDELARIGAPLLLEVLDDLPRYLASAQPQDDGEATYANKILKAEALLDWRREAHELDRAIRAFNPFPVAFTTLGGDRVRVWEARVAGSISLPEAPGTILRADREGILVNCARGQLSLRRLQLAGGKALSADQLLNARGDQFAPGQSFDLPGDDN